MKKMLGKKQLFVCLLAVLLVMACAFSALVITGRVANADTEIPVDGGSISGTITLEDNVTMQPNAVIKVLEGTSATIDLNGHILDLNGKAIEVGGSLTIQDTGMYKERTYFSVADNGCWVLNSQITDGDCFVEGGIITGSKSSAIKIDKNSAEVIINGGNFVGNSTESSGGAIFCSNKTNVNIVLNGGYFVGNYANTDGGAVYVYGSGNFDLGKNVLISQNVSGAKGGGVYVKGLKVGENISILDVASAQGAEVSNNTALYGGGIYIDSYTKNDFYGIKVGGNEATKYGGGIYTYGLSELSLESSTVSGNKAETKGGGMYINSTYDVDYQISFRGVVKVADNYKQYQNSNVEFDSRSDQYIVIDSRFPLSYGANIGITIEKDKRFVNTSDGTISEYFFSDSKGYGINFVKEDVSLILVGLELYEIKNRFAVTADYKFESDSNLVVRNGVSAIIDLSGNLFDLDGRTIFVEGTLTIMDSVAEKKKQYFDVDANGLWTPSKDNAQTEYYVEGGAIIGGLNSAIVLDGSNARLSLESGNIVGNYSSSDGGAIYSNSDGREIDISNGNIVGNIAYNNGGAIYSSYGAKIVAEGSGIISDNVALNGNGGAIFMVGKQDDTASSEVSLSGVTVQNNQAKTDGGGIYINVATLSLDKATIKNNKAYQNGGGLFIDSSAKTNVKEEQGVTIEGNNAVGNGGGAYFKADNVAFSYVTMKNNTADKGGAIYIYGDGLALFNANITQNKAITNGGGISNEGDGELVLGGKVVVDKNTFVTGEDSNLFLKLGSTIGIIQTAVPTDESYIKISMESSGVFMQANATENIQKLFDVDIFGYKIVLIGITLKLVVPISIPDAGSPLRTEYTLTKDVKLDGSAGYYVEEGTNAVIDLNGFVLDLNGYSIEVGGNLTIRDSSTGTPIVHYFNPDTNGVWKLLEQGTSGYSVEKGVLTGSASSAIKLVTSTASFTMTGGNIVGNTSSSYGGAIASEAVEAKIEITGGSICGNYAETNGGGIYAGAGATLIIGEDIQFINNIAKGDGGAVAMYSVSTDSFNGSMTIKDGTKFTSNSATNGGAIYYNSKSSTVTIDKIIASGNNASGNGGFIAFGDTSATVTITDSNISDNSATISGGGMYVGNGTYNIKATNDILNKNTANDGGGIFVGDSNCIMELTSATITGNKVSGKGGAVYWGDFVRNKSCRLTLGGLTTIINNTDNIKANNLFLTNQNLIALVTKNPLTAGSRIGISKDDPYSITDQTIVGNLQYFECDTKGYEITFDKKSQMISYEMLDAEILSDVLFIDDNFSFESDANLIVPKGITATIDLNGNVLDLDGRQIIVEGNLIVTDTNTLNPKTYYFDKYDTGLWYLKKDGTSDYYVTGGVLTGGLSSAIKLSGEYATFTLQNGNIVGNYSGLNGGAIDAENNAKKITIEGGSITGNVARNNGSAIYYENFGAMLTITNGTIDGNTTLTGYGTVVVIGRTINKAIVTLDNATFTNNNTYGDGGALYLADASVQIKNSTFSANTSKANGGALYLTKSEVNIDTVTIEYNNAGVSGGGIFYLNADITFANIQVTYNTANVKGGGIYCQDASQNTDTIFAGDAIITDNTVKGEKNNLFLEAGKRVTISSKDTFSSATSIGITMEYTRVFVSANGTTTNAKCFIPDTYGYRIDCEKGTLKFIHSTFINSDTTEVYSDCVLTSDIVLNNDIEVVAGSNTVIDLFGYNIYMNDHKFIVYGSLTIINTRDVAFTKTVYYADYTINSLNMVRYYLTEYSNSIEVEFDQPYITGATRSVFHLQDNATLNIEAGYYFGNNSMIDGSVVHSTGNNVNINITGGVFKYNSTLGNGGVISITNKANLNIGAVGFENNVSPYNGGAISVESDDITRGLVKIDIDKDAKFSGNIARNGGAISLVYASDDSVTLYARGTFTDNKAYKGNGGAIYVGKSNISLFLQNITIKNNSIEGGVGYGGGVYFYDIETINSLYEIGFDGYVYIQENTNQNAPSGVDNLYLCNIDDINNNQLFLSDASSKLLNLTEDSKIGILAVSQTPYIYANAQRDYTNFFVSDDEDYDVVFRNNKLWLVMPNAIVGSSTKTLNGYYKLQDNVIMDNDISIPFATEAILDLNGYILDLNGHSIIINGKFTLIDSTNGKKNYSFTRADDNSPWVYDSTGEGEYKYNYGFITGATNGAIKIGGNADETAGEFVLVDGGLIGNKNATNGGAITTTTDYVKNGIINILGGAFIGNVATNNGGAVYITDCTLTIDGNVMFKHNSATNYAGGAIYISNSEAINIAIGDNVQFIGNSTNSNNGGAIYASMSSGLLAIGKAKFEGNSANNGGAIYFDKIESAIITLSGSTLQNNHANNYGGGIYVKNIVNVNSQLNISDVTVTNNKADVNGGGIYYNNTDNDGSISFGGETVIKDNKGSNDVTENLYICTGSKIDILTDNALKGDSIIGITMQTLGDFGNQGTDVSVDYFTTDNHNYIVYSNSGKLSDAIVIINDKPDDTADANDGYIVIDYDYAMDGDTVYFRLFAYDKYCSIVSYKVVEIDNEQNEYEITTVDKEDNLYSFVMQDKGVKIIAVFTSTRSIINATLVAKTVVYDGNIQSLTVTGEDSSVAGFGYIYYNDKGYQVKEPINAGVYDVLAYRLGDDDYKYFEYKLEDGLTIQKATIDMSAVKWNYTSPIYYDTTTKTVSLVGLPSIVTPRYTSNSAIEVGQYTAKVYLVYDTDNYNTISVDDLVWDILEPIRSDVSIDKNIVNVIYNGTRQEYTISGKHSDIGGFVISYTDDGNFEVNPVSAGAYNVKITREQDLEYKAFSTVIKGGLVIGKATYDMSEVSWDYIAPFEYDGVLHTVLIIGLPKGVSATYMNNENNEPGEFEAEAILSYDIDNYNEISIPILSWKINPITGITTETLAEGVEPTAKIYCAEGFALETKLIVYDENDTKFVPIITKDNLKKQNYEAQFVYEIRIWDGILKVQPTLYDETNGVTIKFLIPESVTDLTDIVLLNVHDDTTFEVLTKGDQATETTYTVEGKYIVVNTKNLAQMVFAKAIKTENDNDNNATEEPTVEIDVLKIGLIAGGVGIAVIGIGVGAFFFIKAKKKKKAKDNW